MLTVKFKKTFIYREYPLKEDGEGETEYEKLTLFLPYKNIDLFILRENARTDNIEAVMADLSELYQIRDTIRGIPIRDRVTIWRGEFARFIAENL